MRIAPDTPKIFAISEAARQLGLSAQWLREGEKRGVFPPAKRDKNNFRYYLPEDLEALRNRRLLERR
jgi:DNA-binding transcriptional MerR regulator